MKYVKLTAGGRPVLVNFDEVVRVLPAEKGEAEIVFTDGAKFVVQHTLEEVERIIGEATNKTDGGKSKSL